MLTLNKISESLVLAIITSSVISLLGLLMFMLIEPFKSDLMQYDPIIVYTSLILFSIIFFIDLFSSYLNQERKNITLKLFLYLVPVCIFFILTCIIKEQVYIKSNTPAIISFFFFISVRLIFDSHIHRETLKNKELNKSLGYTVTGMLIEDIPNIDTLNFIIVLNKNLRKGKGLWVPPGGHFTPYEHNPEVILERKIHEEIGVKSKILSINTLMPDQRERRDKEVEWFAPPAFLLKEFLPDKCKQNHSHHFDLIYICTTDGDLNNNKRKYTDNDIIRIPLMDCADNFNSTEIKLKNKITERSHQLGTAIESRHENISRDLIWRLTLTAKIYLDHKKQRMTNSMLQDFIG